MNTPTTPRSPKRPVGRLKAFAEGVYASTDPAKWQEPNKVKASAYGYTFRFAILRYGGTPGIFAYANNGADAEIALGRVGTPPDTTFNFTARVSFKSLTFNFKAIDKDDARDIAKNLVALIAGEIVESAHYMVKVAE